MTAELSQKDYLLAEAIIKLSALEKLLVKHGIITTQDLTDQMNSISKELMAFMEKYNANESVH